MKSVGIKWKNVFVSCLFQRMVLDMDITMIVLAALQLCVCVSLSVLGIKAVLGRKKVEVRSDTNRPVK